MGRAQTLRYAVLGLSHSAEHTHSADEIDAPNTEAFTRHATELCAWKRTAAEDRLLNRAVRAVEETAARMRAREAATERRNALDCQRLEDLQARLAARRANALRQRWFVLGRVIDAAMIADPILAARVLALLRSAKLRKDERSAVGL